MISLRHVVPAALLLTLAICAPIASAAPRADDLARVLRIDEVIAVIRDEGLDGARQLNAEMLDGAGSERFFQQIDEIYDTKVMSRIVSGALGKGLSASEMEAAIGYFDTDRGQMILSLETGARKAMSDPDIEAAAREAYFELAKEGSARLDAVTRFVEVNDLIERNVAGGLSSQYQFLRGLADGGGSDLTEDAILSDIWGQEDEVREETRSWIFALLLMAYQPLTDADLDAYIAYSETASGRALNAALFDGFDEMYRLISYALGRSVAEAMGSSEL